jgi:hypothetical protein
LVLFSENQKLFREKSVFANQNALERWYQLKCFVREAGMAPSPDALPECGLNIEYESKPRR